MRTARRLRTAGSTAPGVQTFLAWLAARVELKDGDKQPEPRVLDEDAIVLTTWHSAKGREWPVVAVCGLDKEVKARAAEARAWATRSFEDLSHLLEQARLEYFPKFAAPETDEIFLAELQPVAERRRGGSLYVALTRARDKLVLECPWYLSGKGGTLLVDPEAMRDRAQRERPAVANRSLPVAVTVGGVELPEDLNLDAAPAVTELPVYGRRAVQPGSCPTV